MSSPDAKNKNKREKNKQTKQMGLNNWYMLVSMRLREKVKVYNIRLECNH